MATTECNMPAKGEQAALLAAGGSSSVREMLSRLLAGVEGPWKVEAVLEFDEGTYTFLLAGEGEAIRLACVETPEGEVAAGDRALDAIAGIADKTPGRGYVELQRLTRAGLEFDLSSAPNARVSSGVSVDSLLKRPPPGAGAPEAAPVLEAYAGLEPASREALESTSAETRSIIERVSRGEEISMEEVSAILTELIFYSTTVTVSGDYRRLVREAVERSRANGSAFYRVYVELRDGSVMNFFIYSGRLCSILLVEPGSSLARKYKGSLDELEDTINRKGVARVRLDRISCRDCARAFIRDCVEEPGGDTGRPQEGGTAEPGRRRGGILSRLFGPRHKP